jgi:hypothetical protein
MSRTDDIVELLTSLAHHRFDRPPERDSLATPDFHFRMALVFLHPRSPNPPATCCTLAIHADFCFSDLFPRYQRKFV